MNISLDNSRNVVFYNFRISTLTPSSPSRPEYLKNAYEPLEAEDGLIKVESSTCYEGDFKKTDMSCTSQLTLEKCLSRLGTKNT